MTKALAEFSAPQGTTAEDGQKVGINAIAWSFALNELRVLWRIRTPIVFMFALPAILSLVLGPAVTGLRGHGAQGRATVGFAVLFSYMTVNYAGQALFREYLHRTWMRQAMLQPPHIAYLIGKLSPVTIIGFVQLTFFTTLAFLFLDLPLAGNPLQLLLIGAALVMSGSALGAVLFGVNRSVDVFSSITHLVVIAFGSLGGAFVVSDHLPRLSRDLGYLTPHYWALRALDEATFGGGSWTVVLESLSVIVAITALLLLAAIRLFDYRQEKIGLM